MTAPSNYDATANLRRYDKLERKRDRQEAWLAGWRAPGSTADLRGPHP